MEDSAKPRQGRRKTREVPRSTISTTDFLRPARCIGASARIVLLSETAAGVFGTRFFQLATGDTHRPSRRFVFIRGTL